MASKGKDALPPDIKLPKGVRRIDCSLDTILRQHHMRGPFCHVGSLINKPEVTEDAVRKWRDNFLAIDPSSFTGIDLFPGPNVDVVADLCAPDFFDRHPQLRGKFGTVYCNALLEHVQNPFEAAKTIYGLIAPGGHLYFGGPWVWGYHAYPGDYFRISFDGLGVLFPELDWRQRWYMSTKKRVGLEVDQRAERSVFRFDGVDGVGSLLTDTAMPYLLLGAVGRKSAAAAAPEPRSRGAGWRRRLQFGRTR